MSLKKILLLVGIIAIGPTFGFGQGKYIVNKKEKVVVISKFTIDYSFSGDFTIIYSDKDPDMALRPAGISGVPYNVPTWKTHPGKIADLIQSKAGEAVAGDGFDNRILKGNQIGRTVSITNAGVEINIAPQSMQQKGDSIYFTYSTNDLFDFKATLALDSKGDQPSIHFVFKPKKEGYFSVGYVGAPSFDTKKLHEIWQPLIFQEMRFPEKSYLTPAHMCSLPATFINDGKNTIGVMAASKYLPFNPLPLITNSQFGVALRNQKGLAQPMVFAPIMGGMGSKMIANSTFEFQLQLIIEQQPITAVFENISRRFFGFKDYRKNGISTLNNTLDNIVDYSLSKYALYVDSLKGCAYSTDVPGAVKNVSSLNPIELAMVMDNQKMFEKRGYPLMEFMLSREKFLFSLDSNQKIQNPSRKMNGPVAPVSELVSLYNSFGKRNPSLLSLAASEYNSARERNLDTKEVGANWMNALHLYHATEDPNDLKVAIVGADAYLESRVFQQQTKFVDSMAGGLFFWPSFTNKWIDLFRLYEVTGNKKYLIAAQDGARHYAMFTYMTPAIPEQNITVNKGGKAPMYWYLKLKGHKQMYYPEESVPAWRMSEIGLTPESSGTSSGHRAIFMANYAPWMLKIGYFTNDDYLKSIAKSAIIGRYRNFPGYHINTERTSAYEKFDFPLHDHTDQSVSSFHYNHILPMASMLLDYLVTDVFVRSKAGINFPADFIEGYAYLQNNMYGAKAGSFFNEKSIRLWMPAALLSTSNVELNYIAGRRDRSLFLAFTNQSSQVAQSMIKLNKELVRANINSTFSVYKVGVWTRQGNLNKGEFSITVPSNGLTVVRIDQVQPQVAFQELIQKSLPIVKNDGVAIDLGEAKAYSFRMGGISRAYVFLKADDNKFSEVKLTYKLKDGNLMELLDYKYPFEFTIDLPSGENQIELQLEGIGKDGKIQQSKPVKLGI